MRRLPFVPAKVILGTLIGILVFKAYMDLPSGVQFVGTYFQQNDLLQDGTSTSPPVPRLSKQTYLILNYNTPKWISNDRINEVLDTCVYRNCKIIADLSYMTSSSAVVFTVTSSPKLPLEPPTYPSNRDPDQAWIFFWLEPPWRHGGVYMNAFWRDTVNWTMSYTRDADLFFPYGTLRPRKHSISHRKNYTQIYLSKSKMAAWAVGHCYTPSMRNNYVNKLQEYGVQVDVFGSCGTGRVNEDQLSNLLNTTYKFYLSFENSICKDYITEKFFWKFPNDVVLVVRGGGNYSSVVPNDSYINTADFPSGQHLAKYMLSVASSEEKYTSYLKAKDRYQMTKFSYETYCDVCERLNNLHQNRKTYTDLLNGIHNGTCVSHEDGKPLLQKERENIRQKGASIK